MDQWGHAGLPVSWLMVVNERSQEKKSSVVICSYAKLLFGLTSPFSGYPHFVANK